MSWWRWALVTYVPVLGFLALTLVLHKLTGIEFSLLSRDPVANLRLLGPEETRELHGLPLMGAQSSLCGFLWFCGAVAGALGVAVLWRQGHALSAVSLYLTALSAFELWLGVDDIFMVHDELAPWLISVTEQPFVVLYLCTIIGIAGVFWRTILRRDPLLVLLAISCLGASIVVDHFQERLDVGPYRIFFEDGFKLLGAAGLSGYLIRQAWLVICGELAPRSAGRRARGRDGLPGGSPGTVTDPTTQPIPLDPR
jgi:hypothetical protein